jgi:hypothetical protein
MGKYLKRTTNKRTTNKRTTNKRTTNKRRTNKKRTNKRKTNKKRTNKRGGGKSEQEIIDELKSKGKYKQWEDSGRYFGLTSETLKMPTFKNRPLRHYNVDGEIVNVSLIQKEYRPDLDNIAVFEGIYKKEGEDPSYVEQDTYKIVNSTDKLTTSGLASCAGLTMIIGTKKFMAHLDATTLISDMIDDIKKIISEEHINPEDLRPTIYIGYFDSDTALKKATDICSSLGIPEQNYKIESVCMMTTVHAPTENKRKIDTDTSEDDEHPNKYAQYDYDDIDPGLIVLDEFDYNY